MEITSLKLHTHVSFTGTVMNLPNEDCWIADVLAEHGSLSVEEIAQHSDNTKENVLATVRRLWNDGFLDIVPVNLAIGIHDDSEGLTVWSCGVSSTDPQKIADALRNHNSNLPSNGCINKILVIRNGVDGPVIVNHYNLYEEYQ